MMVWGASLAAVTFISLLALLGAAFLMLKEEVLGRLIIFMVALAAGALLGDAFMHLLPDAFAHFGGGPAAPMLTLAGILLFFSIEKFICWRHCHVPTSEHHPHPMTVMNLVGEAVHNAMDGVLVAASFMTDTRLGLATTLAVVLHEIPHEIGDFGVLLHGGIRPRRALALNLMIALFAVAGAVVTLALGQVVAGLSAWLVPVAAGGFIYVACSDLIPELRDERDLARSAKQLGAVLLGMGMMCLLLLVE